MAPPCRMVLFSLTGSTKVTINEAYSIRLLVSPWLQLRKFTAQNPRVIVVSGITSACHVLLSGQSTSPINTSSFLPSFLFSFFTPSISSPAIKVQTFGHFLHSVSVHPSGYQPTLRPTVHPLTFPRSAPLTSLMSTSQTPSPSSSHRQGVTSKSSTTTPWSATTSRPTSFTPVQFPFEREMGRVEDLDWPMGRHSTLSVVDYNHARRLFGP